MTMENSKRLGTIAIAGTFDRLHKGHLYFILQAFNLGQKVIIGLTSNEFVKEKLETGSLKLEIESVKDVEEFVKSKDTPDASRKAIKTPGRWLKVYPVRNSFQVEESVKLKIQSFQERRKELEDFLRIEGLSDRAEIVKIDDVYGPACAGRPAVEKGDIEALVVTSETLRGGEMVNRKRRELRLKPLKLLKVPLILADDKKRIASTRIRLGEIDRWGRVYKLKMKNEKLKISEAVRQKLKKPQGVLIKGDSDDLSKAADELKKQIAAINPTMIITVGDEVTKLCNQVGIMINLAVFDYKVRRVKIYNSLSDLGFTSPFARVPLANGVMTVRKPAGHINRSLVEAVQKSIKRIIISGSQQLIRILGEDDLVAVPGILLAPLGSVVIYGQPEEGIVLVEVTEEKKQQLIDLLLNNLTSMHSNIAIHIEKSNSVFIKASDFLINWFRLYRNLAQKTLVLLSGGSAVNLYKDLAKFINASSLDFRFLAFAQIDERFFGKKQITKNKEHINAYQIERTGLFEACRKENIPYYIISQEETLEESVKEYNKVIEKLFKERVYKVAVFGIGEDGHTAGLLPGYEKVWNRDDLVVGYENNGEFKRRITLTPHALKKLDQAIVIAAGEEKKRAIYNLLQENDINYLDKYPEVIIQKIPQVDLFTDISMLK